MQMQQVTFDEWCEFSFANGPVTFSEPDADTMEGWRAERVLVVRATGYQTGKKQYFINMLAVKGHRT
jgi:hypothetical protein